MKGIRILFLTTVILFTTPAFANPICADQYGNLRCTQGEIETIDYKGDVFLRGTSVTEKLKTVGDLDTRNAHLNHINIVGDTQSIDTTIAGNAQIIGDLEGKNTQFNGAIKIIGDTYCESCEFNGDTIFVGDVDSSYTKFNGQVVISTYASRFSHTTLGDITVKKQESNDEQILFLQEGTIARNIIFIGNHGVVELSSGAILQGKVTGGRVVNLP